ncbi:phytanoyl-CoA dioxygenase family protein [Acinetobacter lwoffii]|uniref:phytanoyl-CoA dioxygenase family protein n=1 Tax=Acinetobacter lwoffii TaxID=28090 RepID=UPI00209AF320|nr:phytanoyl-CoA dioxygenase family protein [Acinetobacter lwoffii]MCO8097644.1 phytanoyl-CoA dioxygenase family protein [Acinetobacter lwoffii]
MIQYRTRLIQLNIFKKNIFENIKKLDQQKQKKIAAAQELGKILVKSPGKFIWDSMALLTQSKSFESNVILGNPRLNQLGLHRFRVQFAAKMATQRRLRLSKFIHPADVEKFQKNGFIFRENFLAADKFAQLKQELLTTPLETRETLQGDTVTRRMALDGKTLKHMPVTQQFLHSDEWRNLLNYVASFKVQPISYLQVIFSQVRKAKADPQTNLHSDTFHSSAKAWLFLEDVTEDDGPFVYVPGSHQLNPERLNWEQQKSESITVKTDAMTRRGSFRVSEKEVLELGYAKPQAFAVKANTLVIADTYGFHARAKSLKPSVRIELWTYARRNPFVPWLGYDPLSFPVLKSNLVPWYWASLDFLEKRYQRNNPWKKVGKKCAADPAVLTSK